MSGTYKARAKGGDADGADERGEVVGPPMPCSVCGRITPHETLRKLGARCVPCFNDYCRSPKPVPMAPQSVIDGNADRRWARVLRWRHQQGDSLSAHQINAYRKALGVAE